VVQGHVDSVSEIIEFDRDGDDWRLVVGFDAADRGRLVPRGSIAVDGISLTVASLGEDRFTAAIIPHTLEHTNLGDRTARDRVNLEFDVLAKYVERLMEPYIEGRTTS
jgi:riboflavin synthase alpha subunit